MKSIQIAVGSVLAVFFLTGCPDDSLPKGVKIQVNVPDEPYPGTRTRLITFDAAEEKDVFREFARTAKRAGMCSPAKIENDNSAHQVMTISFWGEAVKNRTIYNILKNQKGEWITTGYGGVEIFDVPEGFPKYIYSARALNQVKAWYEKHAVERVNGK
jgi:hypothetical protein